MVTDYIVQVCWCTQVLCTQTWLRCVFIFYAYQNISCKKTLTKVHNFTRHAIYYMRGSGWSVHTYSYCVHEHCLLISTLQKSVSLLPFFLEYFPSCLVVWNWQVQIQDHLKSAGSLETPPPPPLAGIGSSHICLVLWSPQLLFLSNCRSFFCFLTW